MFVPIDLRFNPVGLLGLFAEPEAAYQRDMNPTIHRAWAVNSSRPKPCNHGQLLPDIGEQVWPIRPHLRGHFHLWVQVADPLLGFIPHPFPVVADILGQPAYPLLAFEEKPTEARALELLRESGVAWNAGIFAWRRGAIRDALERHTGLITLLDPVVGSGALVATYDHLPSVSIDVAVMEGAASARQVAMTTMDAGWSDLGSWSSLLTAIGAAGTGRVVQAGEPASAGPDDLVVERENGRLTLFEGPRSILATSPTALLSGAGGSRSQIERLLERVARQEVRA